MKRLRYIAAICLLLGSAAGNSEEQSLPQFEASYNLLSNGSRVAQTKISLKQSPNGEYIYESTSTPKGFVSLFINDHVLERSRWILHQQRIRPMEYLYHRFGGRKERKVNLDFDWERLTVTNKVNDHSWSMKIAEGVLDKFSVNLAVSRDLHANKENLNYQIADGGSLKQYEFHITGKETISTPLGEIETIRVERTRKKKEKTILWCAPALAFYPVRIKRIDKRGDVLTMTIEKITIFR